MYGTRTSSTLPGSRQVMSWRLPTYRTVPTYCMYIMVYILRIYTVHMRPAGTIYRIRREQGEVMSRLDLPCLLSTSRLALRLPLFLLNPPSTLLSLGTLTLRSLNAGSLLYCYSGPAN